MLGNKAIYDMNCTNLPHFFFYPIFKCILFTLLMEVFAVQIKKNFCVVKLSSLLIHRFTYYA